jgi:hypothetical protein
MGNGGPEAVPGLMDSRVFARYREREAIQKQELHSRRFLRSNYIRLRLHAVHGATCATGFIREITALIVERK